MGELGGPWGIFKNTIVRFYGPHFVGYEVDLKEQRSRVRAGEFAELELEPIRNPVSGVEVHPRIVLPEGFVWKDGQVASSKVFRVSDGVSYDHSGQYAAVSPFEYAGP